MVAARWQVARAVQSCFATLRTFVYSLALPPLPTFYAYLAPCFQIICSAPSCDGMLDSRAPPRVSVGRTVALLQTFFRSAARSPHSRRTMPGAAGASSLQELYRVARVALRNGRQPSASDVAAVSAALGEAERFCQPIPALPSADRYRLTGSTPPQVACRWKNWGSRLMELPMDRLSPALAGDPQVLSSS